MPGFKKALLAKPWLQTYGLGPPYFAYNDRKYICEDCGQAFIFWAKEQQYWYETLKFIIDSRPKQCPACRRKRRVKKHALLEVSKAFRELGEVDLQDPAQLARLAELYLKADILARALEFYRRAKNRAKRAKPSNSVQSQIDRLGEQLLGGGTHGTGGASKV